MLPSCLGVLTAIIATLVLDRAREPEAGPGVADRVLMGSPPSGVTSMEPPESSPNQIALVPHPSLPEDPEHEARETQRRQLIHSWFEQHERTEADPVWAPPAIERVTPGLERAAAEAVARVFDIDCRRITCMATIEWADFATAQATYQRFLAEVYELNCTRTILLDPPEDPSVPYQSRIFFDCSDERPLARDPGI